MKRCFLLLALTIIGLGCSSTQSSVEPEVFSVATQKFGQEPAYGRGRYGLPPTVIPPRTARQSRERIQPVVRFELENGTLDEAASMLASTSSYRSYVSSSIASRRVTLHALGTIDELARDIERSAGIKVVVDHDQREVRFLSGGGETPPRFYEGRKNESQSYY